MLHNNSSSIIQTDSPLSSRIWELRQHLKGHVITPDDPDYDSIRIGLNIEIVRHPALIVRPANALDISRVVKLARETGAELAVRSGGHSLAGFSTSDGGIVLDLSQMKGLEINLDERSAWAEPGLTAGEYSSEVAKHGLATGFGDTATVGIGGLTTGGGIGYLVRKHGLTIDNLLAAEIVTADGEILYVDAQSHSDLFWAIRGGGGNFGIITRFQYRLHNVDTIIGGMLVLPATAEVISSFAAHAEAAPDELSTIVSIMPAPPMPFIPEAYHGQLVTIAMLAYSGDLDEGLRVVAPFRQLAKPIVDMIGPMPYTDIYWPDDPDFHPATALRSKFIDRIDEHAAQIMIEQLNQSSAPIRIAEFRVLGGAMSRIPSEATAFAHRNARVMASFIIQYEDREEAAIHNAWVTESAAKLGQDESAVYVNFLGNEGKARLNEAYPSATQERLSTIKAKYDPTNVFRRNHNIAPKTQ